MALPSSGAISLNDMHVEVGGTSGTTASINDSDIRGLIGKASGATMSFSEWYGASAGTSFNLTVGATSNTYPYRGLSEANATSRYYYPQGVVLEPAFGSGPSGWNTTGGILPGVRITAIFYWGFPAYGDPEIYFCYDTRQTNPTTSSTFANLTMQISDSNATTNSPQFPIGSAVRSSYPYTVPTVSTGSFTNVSNGAFVKMRSARQGYLYWPQYPPSIVTGTTWTITFAY
jgi:hypothetical protein